MLTRTPLFPGQEQEEQVQMIIDLLGFPTDEELEMFSDIREKDLLRNIQKRKA
jgi:hypothetical protein